MCGMCGAWGAAGHWSDPARLQGRPGQDGGAPWRVRLAQAAALDALAAPAGVRVRDWQHTAWLVEHPSGSTELAESLPRVWEAVARLTGEALDPLSPQWLARAEAGAPSR